MSSVKPIIDICIATYKRPDLLKKLLLSLITQETGGELSFTIIVVDNDAQRSAEMTVREFKANNGQRIIYDVEPEQNISLARNRALSHATGDYVATIDDDEYADSQWLLNLYKTMVSYEADVVHGPVFPVFHKKIPDYIIKSGAFTRPNPPTGSTEKYVYRTGNSLFRRRLIEHTTTPFDPSFGRTGGEDTNFFESLRRQGCKMVWCREAQAFDSVSPKRANLVWILKRNFRIGNTWHRMYGKGPFSTDVSKEKEIFYIFGNLVVLGCTVPFYILGGIFNLQRRRDFYILEAVNHIERIAFHMGIIAYFLGFRYEEYRKR